MSKKSRKIRREAAQVLTLIEDAHRRLKALYSDASDDVAEVSDEMMMWSVRPSLAVYQYGFLGNALESLKETRVHLRKSVKARPKVIARHWRQRWKDSA
jgi:hypothetical protein